jgi:2-polyprenyl-6-methoxyphenol hydroxylase-like FAD-dependent oxidoreductase
METHVDADVLVVGAGPTGLMLANQLVRRGVSVIIIDRHAGPSVQTRALGVQARTLEIYAQLGIAERALSLGKRGTGAVIWAQGRQMARVPLGQLGLKATPYPYILVLGQDDNEKIMGDKLRDQGTAVQWTTELVGLTQTAGSVEATVKSANGETRKIVAAYVAGCDGARSAVRALCGIDFPGAPYEHVFFVADTLATGNMVPDEVNVYLWRDGFHLLFPMRGENHWRVVGILPEALRGRDDVTIDDVMPSLHQEAGRGLSISACTWFSTYRIQHRRAARFRDRRCFLLGDAAHIHSPVGAQGMNTGLQDAYNLAWKLALAVTQKANGKLLDSYEEERIPVAQRLLDTTDRAFRLVVSDNWAAGILRTKLLARIAAFALSRKRIQDFAFSTVSQTGISYRGSSVSKQAGPMPEGAPRAGDRFPWVQLAFRDAGPVEDSFKVLDDMHFHLLIFGEPAAAGWSLGAISHKLIHVIPGDASNMAEAGRVNIPWPSVYLLRPDGYVGLCGTGLQSAAVEDYLSGELHLRN